MSSMVWIVGPIVSGIIAILALVFGTISCVRRCQMRQALQTQVISHNQSFLNNSAIPNTQGIQMQTFNNTNNFNNTSNFNNGPFKFGNNPTINTFGNSFGNSLAAVPQNGYDPLNPVPIAAQVQQGLLSNNF